MIDKIAGTIRNGSKIPGMIGGDILKGVAAGVVNANVSEINSITTFIGTFIYQNIKGKLARSVTFSTGSGNTRNNWMEEAFFAILYTYNNMKRQSNLDLVSSDNDGTNDKAIYYRLGDGIHQLKYREFDVMVFVNTNAGAAAGTQSYGGRAGRSCTYTISTFSLSENFVVMFEKDMLRHRDNLMKFKTGLGTISIYKDSHESDGWTYWDKMAPINKRSIRTVYLEPDVKTKLVDTINRFFSERKYYAEHGIAHNLKIMLHGPAGPQPDSTMIPSLYGFIRMGDLQVGDVVFTQKGTRSIVTEVHPKGTQDVYEITFADSRTAVSTADHLWDVTWDISCGVESNLPHHLISASLPLSAIMEEIEFSHREFYIPMNECIDFPEQHVSEDPYAMAYDMRNQEPNHQRLADEYLFNSVAVRQACLNGFIDGNVSTIHNNGYCIIYFTGDAVYSAQQISRSLGYTTRYEKHANGIHELIIHRDNSTFLLEDRIKITSIKKLDDAVPVRCIKIDDCDHLYLTEDFVVTHNTGKDTIAKMIASEWHRNIYYATGGKGGRFVPDSLISRNVTNPLFMVSDIDRYPFLINDELKPPEGAQDSATHLEENKQTFAHMINALDGVMSGEDRIIIMTTNHIEKFSPTFLRPGRIDLILEIKRVSVPTFRRFTYDFYGKLLPNNIKLSRDDISIPELQADVVFSRMPYGEFVAKYVR